MSRQMPPEADIFCSSPGKRLGHRGLSCCSWRISNTHDAGTTQSAPHVSIDLDQAQLNDKHLNTYQVE